MTATGRSPRRTWTEAAAATVSGALLLTAYFLLPLDVFDPARPVLGWIVLVTGLGLVAALLLREIAEILADRDTGHPGWTIVGLMALTVVVFSGAYYVLGTRHGQFQGLETRLDALYFTVVTLSTTGYGDITPTGQTARALTLFQILYAVVFLTAATTALTRRLWHLRGRSRRG